MGFSVSAAGAILLVGVLFYVSILTQGMMSAQQDLQKALLKAGDRLQDRNTGALAINNVSFEAGPQRMFLNATNTGGAPFDAAVTDLLVNGEIATENILTLTVDGANTLVWVPGSTLHLVVLQTAAPTNVQLVAPSGAMAHWRP